MSDHEHFGSNVKSRFELEDHCVDEVRQLKVVRLIWLYLINLLNLTVQVVVIGAGISGITAGVLFPAKVPGIDLTIYEKNSDVVSLWLM